MAVGFLTCLTRANYVTNILHLEPLPDGGDECAIKRTQLLWITATFAQSVIDSCVVNYTMLDLCGNSFDSVAYDAVSTEWLLQGRASSDEEGAGASDARAQTLTLS